MVRRSKDSRPIRQPQRGREAEGEEYGRQRRGIAVCPACLNVRYRKQWHPSLAFLQKREGDKEFPTQYEEKCPACTMRTERLFEGELVFEEFPERLREELYNLIYNFGQRAGELDPQDRIIDVEQVNGKIRVTTTENQMATKLARKVQRVFNTAAVDISHSREPYEVDRVRVRYHGM